MKANILEKIPYAVDREALVEHLGLDEEYIEEFDELLSECLRMANPKMIYGMAAADVQDEKHVQVDGIDFESRVLSINLKGTDTVYPYVCTCGREVYEYALSKKDPLERYWVDCVSEAILHSAFSQAVQEIQSRQNTGKLYAMSPGSLPDWPTAQQRPLFKLLGDVMGDIGVALTESCLMLPVKSISGLLFESDQHYTNCSLCPREGCTGRREPFNAKLFYEKYGLELPDELPRSNAL